MQSPLIGLRLINCKAVVQKYIKAGNKEPVKENPHGMLQSWSSATPPWWQGQASACSFCPLPVFCTPDLLHSPCPRASGTVTPCSGLGTALLLSAQSLHQPRKKVFFPFFSNQKAGLEPAQYSLWYHRTVNIYLTNTMEIAVHKCFANENLQIKWLLLLSWSWSHLALAQFYSFLAPHLQQMLASFWPSLVASKYYILI